MTFTSAFNDAQRRSVNYDGLLAVVECEDWENETQYYSVVDYYDCDPDELIVAVFSKGCRCQ